MFQLVSFTTINFSWAEFQFCLISLSNKTMSYFDVIIDRFFYVSWIWIITLPLLCLNANFHIFIFNIKSFKTKETRKQVFLYLPYTEKLYCIPLSSWLDVNVTAFQVLYDRATYECVSCESCASLLHAYARHSAAHSSRATHARVLAACTRRRPRRSTFWLLTMQQAEHEDKGIDEVFCFYFLNAYVWVAVWNLHVFFFWFLLSFHCSRIVVYSCFWCLLRLSEINWKWFA